MSIAIALADLEECILAPDGRMTDDDGSIAAEAMQKSAAISPECVFAATGEMEDVKLLIEALGASLDGVHPVDAFIELERYADGGIELEVAEKKIRHHFKAEGARPQCCALLLGVVQGRPRIAIWTPTMHRSESDGPCAMAIGKTPSLNGKDDPFFWQELANPHLGVRNAEERLVAGVRHAGNLDPEGTIGWNVCTRSMTRSWEVEWHLGSLTAA